MKGLFGIAVLLPLAVETAATAAESRVEFASSSFEVIAEVDPNRGTSSFHLKARRDDGGPVTRPLPLSFEHVDGVRRTHGRILAVGRTSQGNDLLAIYDATSFDLLEVILCRDLALSPSGRFAVFERFFARTAPRQFAYHVTLLYDFAAPPVGNRLAGVPVPGPERRSTDVGRPIYPDTIVVAPDGRYMPVSVASWTRTVLGNPAGIVSISRNEEPTHADERIDRNPDPAYAWSPDERFVAFVLTHGRGESRTSRLVVIEIDNDGRPVRRKLVELGAFFYPVVKIGFVDGSVRLERRAGEREKEIRVIESVL